MKKCRGITLIALVITIIVLLILAGVSLSLIAGENGVLKRATKASLQTELASLEEKANLIYADLSMGQYFDEKANEKVNLTEIIKELEKENYQFKSEETAENAVTGISVQDMTLKVGETGSLNVILEGNSDGIAYYAQIRGEYYLITLEQNGVKVARTPTQIENSGESKTLNATASPEGIVTIGEITENDKIPLQAGNTAGTATITVTYGSLTATCQVTVVIRPSEEATPNPSIDFSTNYATIDVIWIDTQNRVISNPNEPNLYVNLKEDALTPVTWTQEGTIWVEDTVAQATWYNYSEAGSGDTKQSQWANAKNKDGSYFVWIPRYAYRVTYYEQQGDTTPTGYYDGDGMWKAEDGSMRHSLDVGIETVEHNGYSYIVHPAFETNLDMGGWDSDLSGIWVAKYEMSGENSSDGGKTWNHSYPGDVKLTEDNKTSLRVVSKPNVSSWRYINIGNMYINSYNYDRNKESHLMKNSEWGAVSYLTYSQYGRNGYELDFNNSNTCMTGNGGGDPHATPLSGIVNAFNTTIGARASTTGNVYGIYDMAGGSWEWQSSFNCMDSSSCFVRTGWTEATGLTEDSESTKYATKYRNKITDNSSRSQISEVSKMGDAIKEVYRLFNNDSYITDPGYPLTVRGGYWNMCGTGGLFCSHGSNETIGELISFRVVQGE